jgi:lipopolysaccharide biosynthesis protein
MKQPKLVAFYLPQFHPIPENDEWWGTGFTEWTNVVRGSPMYTGHYQPHVPGAIGYYDLRDDSIRSTQAELARQFGIDAFCYYYYWFDGKRLLDRPLEAMLAGGSPDLPFCLCWANENWTRRWDGKDHEVLIAQKHSAEDDFKIIRDLIRYFRDERYLRIGGRPIIIVYRLDLHPEPGVMARRWRDECQRSGIGEIILCTIRRFDMPDAKSLGFDALVDFPPHGAIATEVGRAIPSLNPEYTGRVFDYQDFAIDSARRKTVTLPNFPAVMPSWDNTARKGLRAHIFHGSSPLRYRAWLAESIRRAASDQALPEPIIFINAWNEWAEGCHLEPDEKYGYAWLNATQTARADSTAAKRLWTEYGRNLPTLSISEEKRLSGMPLNLVLENLRHQQNTNIKPTKIERIIAVTGRQIVEWPWLRKAILPIARRLGFAD